MVAVAVVVWVDGDAEGDDLVDAVQDLGAEREPGTWQVRIQLLHGARPDDLPLYTCNPKDFAGIGERVVRPVAIA